ncbi:hypothetical protein R6Q59_008504 [Mikania micrantha]
MSKKHQEPEYCTTESMANPFIPNDHADGSSIDEASKSTKKPQVPEEDGNYDDCRTPTSDDHKIPPPSLPPPPQKLLQKRRRSCSSSDDTEFFEKRRRHEVDEFFRTFTLRVSSSSFRKTRGHSI